MKIDGRCRCGYITFEAEIEPDKTLPCNCSDCQTFSGSAFRVHAFTRANAFKLLSGEPKIYVKTAESGNKRPRICEVDYKAGGRLRDMTERDASGAERKELARTPQIVAARSLWACKAYERI